jgi:hypothetical protein
MMQTLDPGETGGAETPFDTQRIAADRTKIEADESVAWQAAQFAEAAARRRARRLALLLMMLSAAIMIVAGVLAWLTFFA